MRILAVVKMILDNYFAPDPRVYKEAAYLVRQGHDVEILAMDKKNVAKDSPYVVMDGIKVRRIFCRSDRVTRWMAKSRVIHLFKPLIYLWWFFRFIRQCRGYLRKNSYDYLHCHDLMAAVTGVLVVKKDVPLIFDMHEFYIAMGGGLRRKLTAPLVRWIQKHSRHIIATGSFQEEGMREEDIPKVVLLPNYPYSELFPQIGKTASDVLRVSFIGAVRNYDELKVLFDAAEGMDGRVQVRIHGDGSRAGDVKRLSEEYRFAEVFGVFDGIREAGELYRESDVTYCVYGDFNLNSQYAFAVKFYESIHTGTVLIVNRNSAMAKIVAEEQIGYLVTWDDVEEVRSVLAHILDHPEEQRDIRRRMETLREKYTWESVVKNLDSIYS